MFESLLFWLSRVAGAMLDYRWMRSPDGGFRAALVGLAVVAALCTLALVVYG